jgi:hypothetical protein
LNIYKFYSVCQDSIAEQGGLRIGDEIIEVNQHAIETIDDFYKVVNIFKSSLVLKLKVKTINISLLNAQPITIYEHANANENNVRADLKSMIKTARSPRRRIKANSMSKLECIINELSDIDWSSEEDNELSTNLARQSQHRRSRTHTTIGEKIAIAKSKSENKYDENNSGNKDDDHDDDHDHDDDDDENESMYRKNSGLFASQTNARFFNRQRARSEQIRGLKSFSLNYLLDELTRNDGNNRIADYEREFKKKSKLKKANMLQNENRTLKDWSLVFVNSSYEWTNNNNKIENDLENQRQDSYYFDGCDINRHSFRSQYYSIINESNKIDENTKAKRVIKINPIQSDFQGKLFFFFVDLNDTFTV